MTDKRFFIRVIAMLDFQLMAQELGMHTPDEVQCAGSPDRLWVEKHETYLFPIMEKAPIALRYIAQKIAQVKQIPHHDVWIVWSREPKLWSDVAQLAIGEPEDAHKLLNHWGTFAVRRRSAIRTTQVTEQIWPQWLEGEDWFQGKIDPTCLTSRSDSTPRLY